MRQYKFYYVIVIAGLFMVAGGTAGMTYLIKPMMDELFINKNQELLFFLPALLITVLMVKGVGRYIQAYFTTYIGQSIIKTIRDELLERLLKMEIDFFYKTQKGKLISRITSDTARIQSMVSDAIPTIAREGLTVVALVGVVIYHSPLLAFYALVVMPLALYPLSLLAKRMKKISKSSQEKVADIVSRLSEIFNNIEVIKANHTEAFETVRYEKDNRKFFRLSMKATKTNQLISPLMELLGAVAGSVVIIVGANAVFSGEMTVGTFFSFTMALFQIYTPLKMISMQYNKLQDAIVAGERVFEYLDLVPEIKDHGTKNLEDIQSVEFDNVVLRYGDKVALRGINLNVERGETVALVGDSGGGKSSLVNLLVRFYEADEGKLLINGTDIREYATLELRKNIAYVTQRVFIFNDTVAANVAYGEEIDEERVVYALKEANAWDFVSQMEEGIHTVLDEFGVNLSGGQRQRISIARAIYKDPKLLILDEATSALDNKSEALIQEAFDRLTKGRITFVIAHRLSTVQHADKIAVLRHGQIVCMDKDDVLSETCEEYQKLKRSHQF